MPPLNSELFSKLSPPSLVRTTGQLPDRLVPNLVKKTDIKQVVSYVITAYAYMHVTPLSHHPLVISGVLFVTDTQFRKVFVKYEVGYVLK